MHLEWRRDDYVLSTDPGALDVAAIHRFLAATYWSPNIPLERVQRAITHSLCFGVRRGTEQVGFARVISDRSTFAYLADVFVVEGHRGRGLSVWMLECVTGHPDLQNLRWWLLLTRDAHGVYERFGFTPLSDPERISRYMERRLPNPYPAPGS